MNQRRFGAVLASLVSVCVMVAGAQTMGGAAKKATSLGSVRIGHSVMADGKPLAAGTYTLRESDEKPAAVVGQTADESRWIEFVQGSTVKGREMATVISQDALKTMAESGAAPAAGTTKVEMLKGNEYIRVWVNRGGIQYLIHLTVAK